MIPCEAYLISRAPCTSAYIIWYETILSCLLTVLDWLDWEPQTSKLWLHAVQAAVNNAAGTVYPMDVSANPVLATLPGDGIALNLGQLKPCGVLLPHVHPR